MLNYLIRYFCSICWISDPKAEFTAAAQKIHCKHVNDIFQLKSFETQVSVSNVNLK